MNAIPLYLVFFLILFSCRTDSNPAATPPSVSLRVSGYLINYTAGAEEEEFDILVGKDDPIPAFRDRVSLRNFKIYGIGTHLDKNLRSLTLNIETVDYVQPCIRYNRTGPGVEATPALKAPAPGKSIVAEINLHKPQGIIIIDDYKIIDYLNQFYCPDTYRNGARIKITLSATNIAGLTSTTPAVELRFAW